MSELIAGLPEEIALECLTRLHFSTHRVSARVCTRWRELLRSREFYHLRKKTGKTHKLVCLVQSLPVQSGSDELKPVGSVDYGVTVLDMVNRTWNRLDPIPEFKDGLPLFCQVTSSEGKLVVMGGWDLVSYKPVRHVYVYDFADQIWRKGQDMPGNRSFFASGSLDGVVIVAGGHDENKNALDSAWAYDVNGDRWTELTRMSQERDECEGVVIGSEFWVVSGFRTERQGAFEESADVFSFDSGRWIRVENVWEAGRTPRGCVGVGKDGEVFRWRESDEVSVNERIRAVESGEWTFLSGMERRQEFYVVEGQNGKSTRLDADDAFMGFVQSGCCIEI